MDSRLFAAEQKAKERWSEETIPNGEWIIVRVDGRGFSQLTGAYYDKPFDKLFHNGMRQAAIALANEIGGAYVTYSQSDEISAVLHPNTLMFGRRPEKLASIAAGIASAEFSLCHGSRAVFDGRCLTAPSADSVLDYLSWRVADAHRNSIHSAAYWALRNGGASARAAESSLNRMSQADKLAIITQHGRDIPEWAKTGFMVTWGDFDHVGHNPITGEDVPTTRRREVVTTIQRDTWRDLAAAALAEAK